MILLVHVPGPPGEGATAGRGPATVELELEAKVREACAPYGVEVARFRSAAEEPLLAFLAALRRDATASAPASRLPAPAATPADLGAPPGFPSPPPGLATAARAAAAAHPALGFPPAEMPGGPPAARSGEGSDDFSPEAVPYPAAPPLGEYDGY